MPLKELLTNDIISKAESYGGIQAGIALLEDVLNGPSYQADSAGPLCTAGLDDDQIDEWPPEAQTVLVLGLYHPEEDPRLDYWERGDTWGNRRLREVSELLKLWFREKHDLNAQPLPYHVEKGGLFLKDAAVLSGLGVIGRSNLLINPEWGPRIRLRSLLLEGDFKTTEALEGFTPCKTCKVFCQKACPVKAFLKEKIQSEYLPQANE